MYSDNIVVVELVYQSKISNQSISPRYIDIARSLYSSTNNMHDIY